MDKLWKQIILAVTLGILVPQTVFSAGELLLPSEQIPPTQQVATQPAEDPTADPVEAVMYLPVVFADGSVKIMELEDYIRGVVLAEMPASFEEDALKAQAIAART